MFYISYQLSLCHLFGGALVSNYLRDVVGVRDVDAPGWWRAVSRVNNEKGGRDLSNPFLWALPFHTLVSLYTNFAVFFVCRWLYR